MNGEGGESASAGHPIRPMYTCGRGDHDSEQASMGIWLQGETSVGTLLYEAYSAGGGSRGSHEGRGRGAGGRATRARFGSEKIGSVSARTRGGPRDGVMQRSTTAPPKCWEYGIWNCGCVVEYYLS